jgi:muramoyltetrapeptide carboxypeptidase
LKQLQRDTREEWLSYNFFLNTGDGIGITAPASDFDKDEFLKGIEIIKNKGYFPVYNGELLSKSDTYVMKDDDFRKKDFESLLNNQEIKVIIAARGGYGSIRTLDKMNKNLFVKNKKLIVGFSDVTTFHIFLNKNKIPSLHGPMVGAFARDENSTDYLFDILSGNKKYFIYNLDGEKTKKIEGIITGGNLAVIASLIGTKYFYNFKNKIVLFEDLNEPLYKIDRMVMQLKLSGFTPKAIILGQFLDCGEYDKVVDIFNNNFKYIEIFSKLDVGHLSSTLSVPLGVKSIIENNKLYIGI